MPDPYRLKADGTRVRALGMLSGGLDSTMAAKLLLDQGIEVIGVNFSTGFCRSDHHRAMGALAPAGPDRDPRRLRNEALRAGADLEMPVRIVDIAAEYLDVVLSPKHGRGSAMNPCLDCRAFMLRAARAIMAEEGADFVFTGEVLGQRPLSQHLSALRLVEKESGLTGFLLRPLSAHLLAPTEPEKRGWVDRGRLLRLQGRSRKPQLAMAAAADLRGIPMPSGGCCFLTDRSYSARLLDLLASYPENLRPEPRDFLLLKVGRHFRLSPALKLVVSRREAETNFLRHFFAGSPQLEARDFVGALGIYQHPGRPAPGAEALGLMAGIVARYGKGRDQARVAVAHRRADGGEETIEAAPLLDDAVLARWRLDETSPWREDAVAGS